VDVSIDREAYGTQSGLKSPCRALNRPEDGRCWWVRSSSRNR